MGMEQAIEQLMFEYDEAHHSGDGAKLASFFLNDAVIIPPGKPKLVGRSAIDEFYSNISGGSNMSTTFTSINVDAETAYVHGDTEWQADGEIKYLCFVNVLKLIEGRWCYALLTWNTNEGLLKES